MFSNLEKKPIDYGSECYEAQESLAEFLVASADATKALNPGEEVFDHMAMGVERFRIMKFDAARTARRNTRNGANAKECLTENVKTKAPICGHPTVSKERDESSDRVKVMSISSHQVKAYRAAKTVDHCGQFCILSSLGFTNSLRAGAAGGIGAVLMNFDMGAIDTAQPTAGLQRKLIEHLRPQVIYAPSAKARIDRIPRAKFFRQISPRDTGAQDVIDPAHHDSIVFRWPTAKAFRRDTACANVIRSIFLSAPRADQV